MKLKSIKSANYEADAKNLTIEGKDSIGRDVKVSLPVRDRNEFIGYITGALSEMPRNSPTGAGAMPAEHIAVSGHNNAKAESWVVFEFGLTNEGLVRFAVQIESRNDAEMLKIENLLRAGLQEMQRPSSAPLQ